MSNYFVTGSTGVIGSAVVRQLLANGHAVNVLIRADSNAQLQARVDGLFAFWKFCGDESGARARLTAWRGDVSLPKFGLDAGTYAQLASSTSRIVHSAGAVRMNLPIADARLSAVGSAMRIVEFARDCQRLGTLEKVEVVSTVGVGGRLLEVREDWIETQRVFHNTYEQAKAEAEDHLHAELTRGLPLTIHRPSMVVGDSRTGAILSYQIFYHLCEFLSGRRTLGLFPPMQSGSLDIVPVDHVASVLVWSSTRLDTVGRVLHACSGPDNMLPLDVLRFEVRAVLRMRGSWLPPQVELSAQRFEQSLAVVSLLMGRRARRAVATLPVFLDYLATRQCFHSQQTRALLSACGGHLLPPWRSYLPTVLQAYFSPGAVVASA